MATLSGTLQRPDGSALAGYVRFSPISPTVIRTGAVSCAMPVDIVLAENGSFTVALAPGKYWVGVAGIHPFMIYLAADSGSYLLEAVIVWPVTSVDSNVTVWLLNEGDGNYYRLVGSGSGDSLGVAIDSTPSSAPSGVRLSNIWIKSDDGLYYNVTITGLGSEMTIAVDTVGASNPEGTKTASLVVPSLDGDWTNSVSCSGSGSQVGLIIQ